MSGYTVQAQPKSNVQSINYHSLLTNSKHVSDFLLRTCGLDDGFADHSIMSMGVELHFTKNNQTKVWKVAAFEEAAPIKTLLYLNYL